MIQLPLFCGMVNWLLLLKRSDFLAKSMILVTPRTPLSFCLQQAGITSQDLDYVVFYEKPLQKFERILMTTLQTFPQSYPVFRESMVAWFNEKLWIKGEAINQVRHPR